MSCADFYEGAKVRRMRCDRRTQLARASSSWINVWRALASMHTNGMNQSPSYLRRRRRRLSSNRAATEVRTPPRASIRPWALAHLRAWRAPSGDVTLSWVRCAHIGGDGWGPGEPPLGFPMESYRLEILDSGLSIRSETIALPSFAYCAVAQTSDFGSLPGSLHFRVAQLGESGATGLNAELTITL